MLRLVEIGILARCRIVRKIYKLVGTAWVLEWDVVR